MRVEVAHRVGGVPCEFLRRRLRATRHLQQRDVRMPKGMERDRRPRAHARPAFPLFRYVVRSWWHQTTRNQNLLIKLVVVLSWTVILVVRGLFRPNKIHRIYPPSSLCTQFQEERLETGTKRNLSGLVGLARRQTQDVGREIHRTPSQAGEIPHAMRGVESGDHHVAPEVIRCLRENQPQLIKREGKLAPAFAPPSLEGFHRLDWICLDLAVLDRTKERAAQDFPGQVESARGRNSPFGGQIAPDVFQCHVAQHRPGIRRADKLGETLSNSPVFPARVLRH